MAQRPRRETVEMRKLERWCRLDIWPRTDEMCAMGVPLAERKPVSLRAYTDS
ncbi:hypothetical protein NTGHW29_780046 [Candidatus Nitrotoga sp. HW29]|nr:hypothetical protein NTGHW29_780046 [Candidatus Nitrotoga sp. HW29]